MTKLGSLTNLVIGNWKNATGGGKTPVSYSDVATSRLIQTSLASTLYAKLPNGASVLGRPDVMLGVLPLFGARYLEVARSQDVLQYRSVGAEFLGNQKGGNVGIRIDCLFSQADAILYSSILQFMHLLGRKENIYEKDSPLDLQFSNVPISVTSNTSQKHAKMLLKKIYRFLMEGIQNNGPGVTAAVGSKTATLADKYAVPKSYEITSEEQLNQMMERSEDLHLTTPDDLMYDMTTWHKSFPLVTPLEIIYDCYIETLVFSRDIKAPKMLNCTILLRQFIPPYLKESQGLVGIGAFGTGVSEIPRGELTPKDWKNIRLGKMVITKFPITLPTGKLGQLFGSLDKLDFMMNTVFRTAITATKYINNMQRLRERSFDNPIHKWVRNASIAKSIYRESQTAPG